MTEFILDVAGYAHKSINNTKPPYDSFFMIFTIPEYF